MYMKIPDTHQPTYVVIVNGVRYEYPAGAEVDVPPEVAEVLENNADNAPPERDEPTDGGVVVEELRVTVNGYYEAPKGVAYNPVHVNVESGDIPNGIEEGIEFTQTEDGVPFAIKVYGNSWGDVTQSGVFQSINRVEFADNVSEIPVNAFSQYELYDLTELPCNITYISSGAFAGCHMPFMYIFGDNVHMGSMVFENCTNITDVYLCGAYDSINIEPDAFQSSPINTVYVPWSEDEAGLCGEDQWGVEHIHYGYVYEG